MTVYDRVRNEPAFEGCVTARVDSTACEFNLHGSGESEKDRDRDHHACRHVCRHVSVIIVCCVLARCLACALGSYREETTGHHQSNSAALGHGGYSEWDPRLLRLLLPAMNRYEGCPLEPGFEVQARHQ